MNIFQSDRIFPVSFDHSVGARKGRKRKLLKITLGNSNEIYEQGVYPDDLSEKILSEVKFSERSSALQNRRRTKEFYRL